MSLAQLSQLLPLSDDELQQVLDYAATLSKPDAAAAHFSNLLGDSPLVADFISTYNSRRQEPPGPLAPSNVIPTKNPTTSGAVEPVPRSSKQPKKKKKAQQIHTPQSRKVGDFAGLEGKAYNKKDLDFEYIPQRASAPSSSHASRPGTPPPTTKPAASATKQTASSTGGYLISDLPQKSESKSTPVTRTCTPRLAGNGNATKVSIAGGTPMAGQSTALADLDAAIRSLEIMTNPTLLERDDKERKCNCVAARHPLQAAAPNCMSCGKVVCLKEGLGRCSFCGSPLLSSEEIQAMIRELKEERGREKMAANAAANRRAEVARKPAPFTQPRGDGGPSAAEAAMKAREHRDRLLNFQAQNAQRTTVRDEAADLDVTGALSGMGSMWAGPEERARELKRQQKVMREMEWEARPEYEKRQQVVSIDLAGRRIVKMLAAVEGPVRPENGPWDMASEAEVLGERWGNENGGGAFSANPLLGAMMRPVYDAKGKGNEGGRGERKKGWRRVQDDLNDNEGILLGGGIYGHAAGGDEPEPEPSQPERG